MFYGLSVHPRTPMLVHPRRVMLQRPHRVMLQHPHRVMLQRPRRVIPQHPAGIFPPYPRGQQPAVRWYFRHRLSHFRRMTPKTASPKMLEFIFDVPSSRLMKMTGTSSMRNPYL